MDISLIFLMIISTFFGAIGSIFLKSGIKKSKKVTHMLFTHNLYIGVLLFGLGFIIYFMLLSNNEVSSLFPITSLTYIWTSILASKFLKENVNKIRWTGVLFIVLGVSLLSIQ